MYEVLEHWKQYKLEKLELELKQMLKENFIKNQDKCIEELMTKEISHKEFDKKLNKINNKELC